MHTHQKDKLIKSLVDYANSDLEKEVCGFVCYKEGELVFEKTKNISNNPDVFLIQPIDFLERKISGELVAIFHSHIHTKEDPSEYDILNAKNCLFPFLIYSLASEKFNLFDLPHFEGNKKGVIQLKELLND